MKKVNIYLNFKGNCLEVFNFYKSVFGGEFSYFGTFGDMPPQEGAPELSEKQKSQILHVSLPIGEQTVLMGSDSLGIWGPQPTFGNNFSISLSVDTKEDADKHFELLSQGGKIGMPLADMFWGSYFGSFTDKFGINWMVSCDTPSS